MISSFGAWTASSPPACERDRDVVEVVDRRQGVLDPVLGRRRVGRVGDVVGVAHRADRRDERGRRLRRRRGPARTSPRSGRWLGTAAGMASSSSSPHAPVCPGDGAGATGLPLVRRRVPLAVAGVAAAAAAGRRPRRRRSASRRIEAAAVGAEPARRPDRRVEQLAQRDAEGDRMPTIASATSRTNAPAGPRQVGQRGGQAPADRGRRVAEQPRTCAAPRMPA